MLIVSLFKNVNKHFLKQNVSIELLNSSMNLLVVRGLTTNSFSLGKQNKLVKFYQRTASNSIASPAHNSFQQLMCRFYSNETEKDASNDNGSEFKRQLPRISNIEISLASPPFSFISRFFAVWQIRNKYDPDFELQGFIDASKEAVEVEFHFNQMKKTKNFQEY